VLLRSGCYVPRRIYTGEGHGGTHASPIMHYRAEHIRQQAIGPRGKKWASTRKLPSPSEDGEVGR
jgi:hypothetical protein